jgi:hypothetical protein
MKGAGHLASQHPSKRRGNRTPDAQLSRPPLYHLSYPATILDVPILERIQKTLPCHGTFYYTRGYNMCQVHNHPCSAHPLQISPIKGVSRRVVSRKELSHPSKQRPFAGEPRPWGPRSPTPRGEDRMQLSISPSLHVSLNLQFPLSSYPRNDLQSEHGSVMAVAPSVHINRGGDCASRSRSTVKIVISQGQQPR